MGGFHYSVTATLPDKATADRFADWLTGGHIADVIAGGALSGRMIRLDDDPGTGAGGGPIRIETQYLFASRKAYDAYAAGPAVALRAEGVAKFGDAGVAFERRTGPVAYGAGEAYGWQ
jgi:hypothetical protein